jgi:N-acetylmuramoyl-L-alanine amidase
LGSALHSAAAATLEEVRVFAGAGHARVLITTEGALTRLEARSVPAMGERPARGVVLFVGGELGPEGERRIPVGEKGLVALHLERVAGGVQVSAELSAPRRVVAVPIGDDAVYIDLIEEGRGEDPSLPSPAQLQSWVEGALVGPSRPRLSATPAARRLVVVDPGHGGVDHGAVGVSGAREADIALQIAKRTAKGLRDELGAEVILTRTDDQFIALRDRAALANAREADLFLSIHANAAPGPEAWGVEGPAGADPLLASLLTAGTHALSQSLADEVQRTVIRRLRSRYGEAQVQDLGTKTALFYVLVSTRMPSILFEASFVSNPADERRLRSPAWQQLVADALVEAVGRWFKAQE